MKEFWTPEKLHQWFKTQTELPENAYCTENFKWSEYLQVLDEKPSLTVLINLSNLANRHQVLRDKVFKRPMRIISGWRSKSYTIKLMNQGITTSLGSKHITGEGADWEVDGFTSKNVQDELKDNWSGGLGLGSPDFTHTDTSQSPSSNRRWYY